MTIGNIQRSFSLAYLTLRPVTVLNIHGLLLLPDKSKTTTGDYSNKHGLLLLTGISKTTTYMMMGDTVYTACCLLDTNIIPFSISAIHYREGGRGKGWGGGRGG